MLVSKQWLLVVLWCGAVCPAMGQYMLAKTSAPSFAMSWRLEKDSKLVINGKSNFTSIACDNAKYRRADTIVVERGPFGDSALLRGRFVMDVVDFNCHNYFFTSNLRKTLKASEYPHMIIRFLSIDRLPLMQDGKTSDITGRVEISLAGVARQFVVPIRYYQYNSSHCLLMGSRVFRLQDFNLKSTVKVPFVKVENEFLVEFKLAMTRIR